MSSKPQDPIKIKKDVINGDSHIVEVTRLIIQRRLPIKYKVLLLIQSLLIIGLIIGQ